MWDDEAGYDRDDPKHPGYHGLMSDAWDNRDKFAEIERRQREAAAEPRTPEETDEFGHGIGEIEAV